MQYKLLIIAAEDAACIAEIVKLLAVDLLEAYTREQTTVTKRMTIHG